MPRPARGCVIQNCPLNRYMRLESSALRHSVPILGQIYLRFGIVCRSPGNVYGAAFARRRASWPPQCRKHPIIALQTAPATGSGRPHDVRKGVIRWQAVGLSRCTVQRVGVGLGTTDTPCRETAWLKIRDSSIIAPVNLFRCPQRRSVAMRCKLLHHERGLSHSAGNTRPQPSIPRLPGLRRGSHNVPRSTAAGCWPPRS